MSQFEAESTFENRGGRINGFLREFIAFGLKQAWASMFGGFLLLLMIVTRYWYPVHGLYRYDFIFIAAVLFQIFLLAARLETPKESLVIILFHIVATGMELFKTSAAIGSWSYPEPFVIGIGNVPLFAGFMYSAVGSYLARIWRIFNFDFSRYPPPTVSYLLVLLIYINFFSHHYIIDLRWYLAGVTVLVYFRTRIYFTVLGARRSIPLLAGWFLVAFFIWIAENIATFTNIWIYPHQAGGWHPVALSKLGSWYLLMMLSFVLVSLVNLQVLRKGRARQPDAAGKTGKTDVNNQRAGRGRIRS